MGLKDMGAPIVEVPHHVVIIGKVEKERYVRGIKRKRIQWWVRVVDENGKHIDQDWFTAKKDAVFYHEKMLEKYPI